MSIDKISQPEILVRVDFHDAEEKAKLVQYPGDAVKGPSSICVERNSHNFWPWSPVGMWACGQVA